MTGETKRYLASDLSVELALPRSTINDWLARYNDYLEAEIRGKRKYYSEKSLNILKEISGMRNSGMSSFEIEQQLAARYGIRPEVAPAAESAGSAGQGTEPAAAAETPAESQVPAVTGGNAPFNPGEALPILRPAFDEMSAKFSQEFSELARRFEAVERERERLTRRMWTLTVVALVGGLALLLLLAAAVWGFYGKMRENDRKAAVAAAELNRKNGELAGQIDRLGEERRQRDAEAKKQAAELAVLLDKSRADFKESVSRLNQELSEQRRVFETQLKKLEADAASRAEADAIRLREEFARKQQQELRRIAAEHEKELKAAVEKAGSAKQDEAEKARLELERRRGELEQLRSRIAELERLRNGESASEKTAETPVP